MVGLKIILEGDGCWEDLADKEVISSDQIGDPILIAALAGGTVAGKPTVTLRVDLPDGRVVLAQTTLSLLLMAADGFKARYGDPRHDA